jgi:hypothetical protein
MKIFFSYEPGFGAKMLALNIEKANFILFERWSAICLSDNHIVRNGDGIVQRVDTIKYLSLYLNTKLHLIIYGTFRKKYCQLCLR